MNGILNINKPQNMTSHDVVSVVRRTLGMRQVGHTGTLDPMATGVLPICVGNATRIMDYLDYDLKKYRCTILFGRITDTQDIWGKTLVEMPTSKLTKKQIEGAFSGFKGVILQKPPMYSAIKIDGKRLYEYAREGKEPPKEVKTRKIYIKDLQLEDIDLDNLSTTFTVLCSKGTYIRTICQDVGEILGCGATMSALERVQSGRFVIEESIDLEEFRTLHKDQIEKLILKPDYPLKEFGRVVVDKIVGNKFVDGWHIPLEDCITKVEPKEIDLIHALVLKDAKPRGYRIYMEGPSEDEFLGVAYYSEKYKKLKADKVFYRRSNVSNK